MPMDEVVPLHLQSQADARLFIQSQPTLEEIQARSVDQLRLVASLFVPNASLYNRELCVQCIQRAIAENWPEKEDAATLPVSQAGFLPVSRSSSVGSLITQEDYTREEEETVLAQIPASVPPCFGVGSYPAGGGGLFNPGHSSTIRPPEALGKNVPVTCVRSKTLVRDQLGALPRPSFTPKPPSISPEMGGCSQDVMIQLELKKLELKAEEKKAEERMQRERLAAEAEERRLARERLEAEERMHSAKLKADLEKTRIEAGETKNQGNAGNGVREETAEQKLARSLKLVPAFDESKVTEWFTRFEKKAREFQWSEDRWVGLVVNVLKGKALEAYDRLTVDELNDYEEFKSRILKAYQLRPEAYRLMFRGARKRPSDTYVEYACYLRDTLRKWLLSEKAKTKEEIEELFLLEHFINNSEKELGVRLREKRFSTLKEAAVWADDRILALRGTPGKASAIAAQTKDRGGSGSAPSSASHTQKGILGEKLKTSFKTVACYFCKQKGHIRPNCPKWKAAQNPSPVSLVVDIGQVNRGDVGLSEGQREAGKRLEGSSGKTLPAKVSADSAQGLKAPDSFKNDSSLDWCRRFLHSGVVEMGGKSFPVTIFRDTGAKHSMCRNLTGSSVHTGEYVLCRGVNADDYHDLVPITLDCPFVKTSAKVAVAEVLPMEGVDFFLGADLVGDQVFPSPVVVSEMALEEPEMGKAPEIDADAVFPVCAVTRSMSQIAQEEELREAQAAGTDSSSTGSPLEELAERDVMVVDGVLEGAGREACVSSSAHHIRGVVDSGRGNVPVELTPDEAPKDIPSHVVPPLEGVPSIGPTELAGRQQEDNSLKPLFARVEEKRGLEKKDRFVLKQSILYRQWLPHGESNECTMIEQVVVPVGYRAELIRLAHEAPLAGHLGVRKTIDRLKYGFWWPSMGADVSEFVKTCHVCQVTGKPNQKTPVAPLVPIPVVETPFTRVIIDMVGPLPPTSSGNKYLLTIMDTTTRYPEASPMSSMRSKPVIKHLIKFFTYFGLPREIQSDRGSNFTSTLFAQLTKELGIIHIFSSAYHPQSQGALERYHQTLKAMLRRFCLEHEKDWDVAIPFVLFAMREVPNESLGFSPNELVFGHRVRGPLTLVKEVWTGESDSPSQSMLDFVGKTRERLHTALELARSNLVTSQAKMKAHYDQKAKVRDFTVGDEVLVLLPLQGQPLSAKFSGPYHITKKVSDLDYLVATPDRRKGHQLCHVNMLKPYFRPLVAHAQLADEVTQAGSGSEGMGISELFDDPDDTKERGTRKTRSDPVGTEVVPVLAVVDVEEEEGVYSEVIPAGACKDNSYEALCNKLQHLQGNQREELCAALWHFPKVFGDSPGVTTWAVHDIDVGDNAPVKLPPYRVNPQRQAALEKELKYMLEKGLITRGYSEWSSPVTLHPKPDGKVRFCVDFRKVNQLSKTDTYPIPRVDDSVDRIGVATFITKVDLMKGYWQVPLTERAKQVASFVVSGALYQCQVMPFGLKNAPATFQRLMDRVVDGVPNCAVYIDDVIIFDTVWADHVSNVERLFQRLDEAGLVVNLEKCEFVQASVQYLGYIVGHGKICPPRAKVEAIRDFKVPHTKRSIQRFLGMIGYYRRFIRNYSTVLAPLTDLLRKDKKFMWTEPCQQAFEVAKSLLCHHPILRAPDFERPFVLAVDASDVGIGAVLMQEHGDGVEHPTSYYSKKFNRAQKNYSVVEKELLAIILALQHYAVYLPPFGPTIRIYSDHHPLQFLHKFKYKNQRLTRWSLMLQEYNLDVRHIKGVDNVLADCLSRG